VLERCRDQPVRFTCAMPPGPRPSKHRSKSTSASFSAMRKPQGRERAPEDDVLDVCPAARWCRLACGCGQLPGLVVPHLRSASVAEVCFGWGGSANPRSGTPGAGRLPRRNGDCSGMPSCSQRPGSRGRLGSVVRLRVRGRWPVAAGAAVVRRSATEASLG
jgi:hypothetical protein